MKAEVWNFNTWIEETNPEILRNKFSDLLGMTSFGILDFTEHHFEPEGYTALWLLEESHFAIHTWPEHGRSYIELTSCNEAKHLHFMATLRLMFKVLEVNEE